MKKVKTIILSLIMICASAFISACSCGGEEPSTQILAENIFIECTSADSGVEVDNTDKDVGKLLIKCHVGEEFKIRYTLTPPTTTVTQVMWTFSRDGLVKSNINNLSRSVSEEVTFKAEYRTKDDYQTTLTFVAKNGSTENEKKAVVEIEVYDPVENLPKLGAPTNIRFNADENKLEWDAVKNVWNNDVEVKFDKTAVGLAGYNLEITNLDTGKTDVKSVISNEYTGLEKGINYAVKVKALGDNLSAVTGDLSEVFRCRQLLDPTNVANNNGRITFSIADANVESKIYYIANDNTSASMTSGTYYDIVNFENFEKLDSFDISVQAYPNSYISEVKYGIEKLPNSEDSVFVYPSNKTESINVRKLITPNLTLEHTKIDSINVGGVTFSEVEDINKAFGGARIKWDNEFYPVDCNVRYSYKIYKNSVLTNPVHTENNFTDNYINIAREPGEYILQLNVLGEASKVIPSEPVEFRFTVLPHISDMFISSNKLTVNTTASGLGGIELFFVSTNANSDNKQNNSMRIFSEQASNGEPISIDTIGLTPDSYDIYARFVGSYNKGVASTVLGNISKINTKQIKVLSNPTESKIDSNGTISFNQVTDAHGYKMILTKLNSESSYDLSGLNGGTPNFIQTNGNRASFDIYNVFDTINSSLPEIIKLYWVSGVEYEYKIIACGDGSDVIDSTPSSSVNFYRSNSPTDISLSTTVSTETLSIGKTISFSVSNANLVNNGIKVRAKVGDTYTVSEKVILTNTGLNNSFEIPTSITNNISELLAATNEDLGVSILIQLIGWQGIPDTDGMLDSLEVSKEFSVASIPTNLNVTQEGLFSWQSDNVDDSDYFRIIYTYNDGEKDVSIFDILSKKVEAEEGSEQNGYNVEIDETNPDNIITTYSYNIQEKLKTLANKVVTITIDHWSNNKFTDNPSVKRYAQQLGVPTNLSYAEGYNLTWDVSSTGLYNILVESDIEGFMAFKDADTNPVDNLDITSNTFSIPLSGEGAWGVGQYRISILNKSSELGTGLDSDNPYILNSVYSTPIIVNIVSGVVEPTANGDSISWSHIGIVDENVLKLVKYTLNYGTTQSAGDISQILTTNTYNLKTSGLDFFNGTNIGYFQVVPSINYVDTGYILIGESVAKTITKLSKPVTPVINNGVMTFGQVENATTYEIYINGSIHPVSGYSLTFDEGTKTYTIVLNGTYTDKEIQIKALATGYITSELSTAKTFSKLATVSEFSKDGDWLVFKPVENANYYEINIMAGETLAYTIKMHVTPKSGTAGYDCQVEDEAGQITNALPTEFTYDLTTGQFKYAFNMEVFKMTDAKDYTLSIIANYLGDNTNLLKSDESSFIITRLATISADNLSVSTAVTNDNGTPEDTSDDIVDKSNIGNIQVSGYSTENTTYKPVSYSYTIRQYFGDKESKLYTANHYTITTDSNIYEYYVTTNPFDEDKTPIYTISNASLFTMDSGVMKLNKGLLTGTVTIQSYNSESKTFADVTNSVNGDYITFTPVAGSTWYQASDSSSTTINLFVVADTIAQTTIYTIESDSIFTFDAENNVFKAKKYVIAHSSTAVVSSIMGSVNSSNTTDYITWAPAESLKFDSDIITYADNFVEIINLSDLKNYDSENDVWVNFDKILPAGTYDIEFTFYGDNVNSLDSEVSARFNFEKLSPSIIGITSGVMQVSNVTGATQYRLLVSKGAEIVGTFDVAAVEGASTSIDETTASALFELIQPDTTYTISVIAMGMVEDNSQETPSYINSDKSKTFDFKKMSTPTNLKISSCENGKGTIDVTDKDGNVTTLEINDRQPIVSWNSNYVTSSQMYEITIGEQVFTFIPNGIMQYPISTDVAISGADSLQQSIQLRLIGSTTSGNDDFGYISSDYITTNATYVKDVSGVKVQDGVITWNPVDGAYTYVVRVYDNASTLLHTIYTAATSYAFDSMMEKYQSADFYTIKVNAMTNPFVSIVSTNEDTVAAYTNSLTVFKPEVISDLKVKNGLLNWTVSTENISKNINVLKEDSDLTTEFEWGDDPQDSTIIRDIIDYINRVINGAEAEPNIDSTIGYLYQTNFDISGYRITVIPSSMTILNGNTTVVDYALYHTATALEFSYFLGNEIPVRTEDAVEGEKTASQVENNETTFNYAGGLYDIKIATSGNSNSTKPVASSGYSPKLTVYKPLTPRTRLKDGADILDGIVRWDLVASHESAINNVKYYEDYVFEARVSNGEGRAWIELTNDDDDDDYVVNSSKYQAEQSLRNLFVTSGGINNIVTRDVLYNLYVYVKGTANSSTLEPGKIPYLNSNSALFNEQFSFLSAPTPAHQSRNWVANSELAWGYNVNAGSTSTRVSIDGPIKFPGVETPTTFDDTYDEIINFGKDENGNRATSFTLTDKAMYLPGDFKFTLQNIGNGRGILDSEPVKTAIATKLAQPQMFGSSWVGQVDATKGMFVWSPVSGANAYKVVIYSVDTSVEDATPVSMLVDYTTNTYYDLPAGTNQFESDLNEANCKYFIRISACKVDDIALENGDYKLSDNFFISDRNETSRHSRIAIASDIKIDDDGMVSWNNGEINTNISHFNVRYLSTIDSTVGNDVEFQLPDGFDGEVTVEINSIAVANNQDSPLHPVAYLNSGYSSPVLAKRTLDPVLELVSGVYNWAPDGEAYTDAMVKIDSTEKYFAPEITNYKYYTDLANLTEADLQALGVDNISDYLNDYTIANDERTFATGKHNFTTYYKGGKVENDDGSETMFIKSNTYTLEAYKLLAPRPNATTFRLYENSQYVTYNAVKWQTIPNASGYKVIVFAGENTTPAEFELNSVEGISFNNDIRFVSGEKTFAYGREVSTDYMYLSLNNYIDTLEIGEDGIALRIFVQAIGSTDTPEFTDKIQTNSLYLSSSYSTKIDIAVPPAPEIMGYDPNTGKLTFNVGEDENKVYNVEVITIYEVNNVDKATLINYWYASSDIANIVVDNEFDLNSNINFGNPSLHTKTIAPYAYSDENGGKSGILTRELIVTLNGDTYDLQLKDTIMLLSKDYNNKTPNEYKLTSIGENYYFTLTALAGTDINTQFKSQSISSVGGNVFRLFDSGDGSEYLPYNINKDTEFNSIRYFTDRHYDITNDIEFNGNWTPIASEFTGSINGNNNLVSGINITKKYESSESKVYYALMNVNSGTIANLRLGINIEDSSKDNILGVSVFASNIAITNNGTIDNVHIINDSKIDIQIGINAGIMIGGLVVTNNNNATIINSSVNADITGLDASSNSTYVGGIAKENKGNISNTYYNGRITGNYVAGISNNNKGSIDRVYVTADSVIAPTNKIINSTSTKGGNVGGIVSTIHKNGSVTNSYSLATIEIDTIDGNSLTIGGLIGSIKNDDGTAKDIVIKNNYVVLKITTKIDGGKKIATINAMMPDGNATMTDNYYISTDVINGAGEKVASETELETKLSDLRDDKDRLVYDIDNSSSTYPTHIQY